MFNVSPYFKRNSRIQAFRSSLKCHTAAIDCGCNDQAENLFVLIQLEDYIPEVEEFYRKNHSGRKLQWHHLMSNGVVSIWSFFVVLLLQQTISRNVKILGRSETVESRPFK